jgi:hypothetical protein
MGIRLANNAVSRLAGNISNSATTIVLVSGDGALFPALAAGEWFPATIINSANAFEIVKVTARSSDTLTGERGAASKIAVRRGDLRVRAMQSTQITAAPTKDDFNRLQADVAALYGLLDALRLAGTG